MGFYCLSLQQIVSKQQVHKIKNTTCQLVLVVYNHCQWSLIVILLATKEPLVSKFSVFPPSSHRINLSTVQ